MFHTSTMPKHPARRKHFLAGRTKSLALGFGMCFLEMGSEGGPRRDGMKLTTITMAFALVAPPAFAASIDYIGPMPRDPKHRAAWESRGGDKYVIRDETLAEGISPKAYRLIANALAEEMQRYQDAYTAGTITLRQFEAAQKDHAKDLRSLRTSLNTYNMRKAREDAGLPDGLGRGTGEDGRFNGD
jgi:hypothetical protein